MRAWWLTGALAFTFFLNPQAAAQRAATEGESHILSAFTSGADPGVLADDVRLGPALRASLGAGADSARIYAALAERTTGRTLRVDVLPPAQAARHAALAGGSAADPLIELEAGELLLLMQYATARRRVVFVEQLSGPAPRAEPAPAPKPVPAPAPAPAPVPAPVPAPAPVIAVPAPPVAPAPAVVEKPAPPPPAAEKPKPAPVAVPKAPPAPAKPHLLTLPPPRTLTPQPECVIKPVMTDEELRACGVRR